MASRDDDRLRVRPGAPKHRGAAGGQRAQRFVSQVLTEVSKAGGKAAHKASGWENERGPGPRQGNGRDGGRGRPASAFGRGRVAAALGRSRLGAKSRRVVIKSRFVVLKRASATSVATHLRYIERDGVTRDGRRGQAYDAETDAADLKAFEERGRGDRHQFRLIVSLEDAQHLQDLRGFTRELMRRMAIDLETDLDWVAVDHWDTDNPHTHVVLRGKTAQGLDLVIAPDYMAHGMRWRASELATEWLGPRTEREIQESLLREVDQERLTGLDRSLLRQAEGGVVDLAVAPDDARRQALLRARLQRLQAMDLAEQLDANRWRLQPCLWQTLSTMGERGDILRAMQRALHGQPRDLVLEASPRTTVLGRLAGKGLADELNGRPYVVIDGVDGRAHYLRLPASVDVAALPLGGVAEVGARGGSRAVDKDIAGLAREGLYRSVDHVERLHREGSTDPMGRVQAHERRLEALQRAGLVERLGDGVWRVPKGFEERARTLDSGKAAGLSLKLCSHLPIEQQVRSMGATWLDRQLVRQAGELSTRGFGAEVRRALRDRLEVLLQQGLAWRQGQRTVIARNLLQTLRERELAEVGKALQVETGLAYRPLSADGQRVEGIYRRSVQLVSGRFAMLDDGMGFMLVPWRAGLEERLGQRVSGVMRGSVNWMPGERRGL